MDGVKSAFVVVLEAASNSGLGIGGGGIAEGFEAAFLRELGSGGHSVFACLTEALRTGGLSITELGVDRTWVGVFGSGEPSLGVIHATGAVWVLETPGLLWPVLMLSIAGAIVHGNCLGESSGGLKGLGLRRGWLSANFSNTGSDTPLRAQLSSNA